MSGRGCLGSMVFTIISLVIMVTLIIVLRSIY